MQPNVVHVNTKLRDDEPLTTRRWATVNQQSGEVEVGAGKRFQDLGADLLEILVQVRADGRIQVPMRDLLSRRHLCRTRQGKRGLVLLQFTCCIATDICKSLTDAVHFRCRA